MTTNSVRIQASALLLLLFAPSCWRNDDRSADSTAVLLHSTDRVAVYDAGVDAYRRKEYAAARELWQHAVELGDHNAASNLGFLLYHGWGGAPDSVRAIAYWQAAMAQGDAEAHRHVAQAIMDGDRRLGSESEAYAHALAARVLAPREPEVAGAEVAHDADELVNRIRSRLSVKERQAGDSLAHVWTAARPVT